MDNMNISAHNRDLTPEEMHQMLIEAEARGEHAILVFSDIKRENDGTAYVVSTYSKQPEETLPTSLMIAARATSEDNVSFIMNFGDLLQSISFENDMEKILAGKYLKGLFRSVFRDVDI